MILSKVLYIQTFLSSTKIFFLNVFFHFDMTIKACYNNAKTFVKAEDLKRNMWLKLKISWVKLVLMKKIMILPQLVNYKGMNTKNQDLSRKLTHSHIKFSFLFLFLNLNLENEVLCEFIVDRLHSQFQDINMCISK